MGTIFSEELLSGQGPKYRRLVDGLVDAIKTGALPEGEKLPPVRDLAWELKITPGTVARAYSILGDEGWVLAEVGRGTYVQPLKQRRSPKASLGSGYLKRQAHALHSEPETDFLFAPRLPDVGQVNIIKEAIHAATDLPDTLLLRYPFHGSQAYLREALLDHIPESERGGLSADDIVVTNGGQNAIMLSMQTLLAEGPRVVMVEEHSYPGLRRAVELLGAKVVAVPMDERGIDPQALEHVARSSQASLLFTMPEAHNPTCRVTDEARRHEVADVARKLGFHVVQDDCYRLGPARAPSYRSLLPEQSWFISSFSKTISPALRAGYAVTPSNWAGKLRRVVDVNYFGISSPTAEILYQVLTHPDLERSMSDMRRRNREYIEIAVNMLGRYELGWSHDVPFFWLKLPLGWRVSNFCQKAENKGIRVRPGDDFALRDGPSPQAVRISVNGQMPLDRFRSVLSELVELLDNPTDTLSA
ncbi:PLP-dependent aminotransferase family protein [Aliiroseovarius sp. F20344]|uniref:aminotransferase-like domain-containing protein n=1 Tax=Aliiroseovarius sp. F20344 TaxID=2926414 RepID=UPI001FF6B5D4|nr:PLP-dependent aminotransferase family protein [Aliiroseovarius sp. F20344]MCK0143565.1 PLP-dependent aminotransferase family protein [Aliiroseovarius sp. F20344]